MRGARLNPQSGTVSSASSRSVSSAFQFFQKANEQQLLGLG